MRFFSCLDGLRALSILAVIWHHAAAPAFAPTLPLIHYGNQGVTLFFVISAFLISTLLLRAKAGNALDVPKFLGRRALRILPLYYAVLLLYVAMVFLSERSTNAGAAFFENLKYFATFTSNWFVQLEGRVIFYFAWSLAAEEQFYICWPWVERYLPRMGPVLVAVTGLVITQAAGLIYVSGVSTALLVKILASVPEAILLGVLLAHALHSPRGFRMIYGVAGRRGAALGGLGVAGAALLLAPHLGYFAEIAIAVALTVLVATCVVREDATLAPVLRLRWLAWVGTVSYGVYLLHMLSVGTARRVAESVFNLKSPYWDFGAGAVLSIGVATLSYWTFERFFLRLKDRWFGESRATSPTSTPAGSPGTLAVAPDALPQLPRRRAPAR